MAEAKREFAKPIFQAKGKNSFFEAYDNLNIDKILMTVSIYDPELETNKTTHKASFYIDYPAFLGLSALVTSGHLDEYVQESSYKSFPKYSYTEGKNLRTWSLTKTDKGNYQITITEKEKGSKWEEAKLIDKASFYIHPFDLVSMCKTVEMHILGIKYVGKENPFPRVARVEETQEEMHELSME